MILIAQVEKYYAFDNGKTGSEILIENHSGVEFVEIFSEPVCQWKRYAYLKISHFYAKRLKNVE